MTHRLWCFVNLLAQLLEGQDREAVEGDWAESGASAWQALRDVLGFVVRQHVQLWKSWRPWLAAFGLAVPGALLLMGLSLGVSQGYQLYAWIIHNYSYIDPNILDKTGLTLTSGVWLVFCQLLQLMGWSWTGGFVLASLSRRTVWVSTALCGLPVWFTLSRFHHMPVSPLCLFLFLPTAIWGIRKGLRLTRVELSTAIFLATAVMMLAIPTWSRGRWIFNCALSWPAWYLVATARNYNRRTYEP